ncbi:hypothetical protein QTG54_014544 [Skeletonema marinoi]|uniref:HRDC domain-containing protein n=1 Tax=Skeletonema marinoi TaxID=267567 RepID=A0AAD8XWM3_9STRA|nr:hypothetical protein QTG54_014544 [Skeletonema marinoi]
MGKNRRRRNKKWYHRRNSNQDDGSNNNLSEVELILVEKFLSDYRSLAYSRRNGSLHLDAKSLVVGEHMFPSLTDELCSRPYIELPETLNSCALLSITDLYHTGIGPKSNRRIAISIYADGFRFIPDEDSESSFCSYTGAYTFPYSTCKPWYYLDTDTTAKRLSEIEDEKQLIHQFVKYPEKSLTSLNLADMEQLDLSVVKSVEDTTYELIDTVAKLKICVDELRYGHGHNDTNQHTTKLSEIAFDMEIGSMGCNKRPSRSSLFRSKYSEDRTWYWGNGLFFSPQGFGILVVNAFDTCEASSILRQSKGGMNLAALCKHYGLQTWEHYCDLKDRFQTTNWCKRPLSSEALEYGRYDVRYLITLRRLLMRDLIKMDMINSVPNGFDNASCYDAASNYDSTSMSESTREQLVSSSSQWSSISESSIANSGHQAEKSDIKMSVEAIISASDLPSFEKFMKAVSISQKRCLKLWAGKEEGESESILRNPSFISMIKQSANKENQRGTYNWTEKNTKLYTELADWRMTVAERESVAVNDVCSLDLLCWVSYKLPQHRSELRRFEYILPAL